MSAVPSADGAALVRRFGDPSEARFAAYTVSASPTGAPAPGTDNPRRMSGGLLRAVLINALECGGTLAIDGLSQAVRFTYRSGPAYQVVQEARPLPTPDTPECGVCGQWESEHRSSNGSACDGFTLQPRPGTPANPLCGACGQPCTHHGYRFTVACDAFRSSQDSPALLHTHLYPLITAGQAAVRAAESHGAPETVGAVDASVCALPANLLDRPATQRLHQTLRSLPRVEEAPEWTLLADLEQALSTPPDTSIALGDAARRQSALTTLVQLILRRYGRAREESAERAAWERAAVCGHEVSHVFAAVMGGEMSGEELDRTVRKFVEAVRRAVPYQVLIDARDALAEAARAYGLFVIGMRQPSRGDRWQWTRTIAGTTYRFAVRPPLTEGHPYGAVDVQRIDVHGSHAAVRSFPPQP